MSFIDFYFLFGVYLFVLRPDFWDFCRLADRQEAASSLRSSLSRILKFFWSGDVRILKSPLCPASHSPYAGHLSLKGEKERNILFVGLLRSSFLLPRNDGAFLGAEGAEVSIYKA
jgi:hypothetical protein